MPILHSGKTEAQKCEGAHTRPCTAPVAKSLECKGQIVHKPALICPLPGYLQTLYGTRKRWFQSGQNKSLQLHEPLCSAAFDDHMEWERGNWGQSGVPRMGREIGREGKEAAASPRHLTPTWGWFGPIPCTRARSSFGTGPTCPGKSRARKRGQGQGLSLW